MPTISRFENSLDKHSIFEFSNAWADNYVSSLSGRKRIVIDVDAADGPTHGRMNTRHFIRSLAYGMFLLIKQKIKKSSMDTCFLNKNIEIDTPFPLNITQILVKIKSQLDNEICN